MGNETRPFNTAMTVYDADSVKFSYRDFADWTSLKIDVVGGEGEMTIHLYTKLESKARAAFIALGAKHE